MNSSKFSGGGRYLYMVGKVDLHRIPVLKLRLRVISHRRASTHKQLDFE